jgi:hypothetical protein
VVCQCTHLTDFAIGSLEGNLVVIIAVIVPAVVVLVASAVVGVLLYRRYRIPSRGTGGAQGPAEATGERALRPVEE